jgi:hypothetical protein
MLPWREGTEVVAVESEIAVVGPCDVKGVVADWGAEQAARRIAYKRPHNKIIACCVPHSIFDDGYIGANIQIQEGYLACPDATRGSNHPSQQ